MLIPIVIFIFLVGRWSQDTGSDNEMHSHKTSSPNPLPNPDLTDTSYLHQHQNKMNMPPSILENIHENYNVRTSSVNEAYDNDRYNYGGVGGGSTVDVERDSLYGNRKKDYQDNYGEYGDTTGYSQQQQQHQHQHQTPSHYGSEHEYAGTGTQIVNQMRGYQGVSGQHENVYQIYDKQRPTYLGAKTESPYMSKERIHTTADMYSPRDNHYVLKSPPMYGVGAGESVNSVHSMLKSDYHVSFSTT